MKRLPLPAAIIAVFLFSLVYWLYLASSTQMQIANDAIGYQDFGRLLKDHGFIAYFKDGPRREPIYPLLVMLSMHLEAISGIAYTKIMAFLCVLILWATQSLIYLILKKLQVRTSICAVTMAYFAVSPAMNNAAFSLYSEIAAFPLVLLVLLANFKAYECIIKGSVKDALLAGLYLGLSFTAVTFVKGIFEFIFLAFFLLYLTVMIACFLQGKKKMAINCLLVLFAFCASYQIPITAYKLMNKKYNGQYALTNRGSWAFYASCARRAEKLTPDRLLAALAYIPGKYFCEENLGKEKCYFWGIESLDSFGVTKFQEIRTTTPHSMLDQKMAALSKEKIMQNPAQFFFLMSFDAVKMCFWESTQIGFVGYPVWLSRIYGNHLFKDGLRAIVSLLSLAGFTFLMIVFFKKFTTFFKFDVTADTKSIDSVLIFILLSSFIGFYALFDTIPRFALPSASLQLITIALLAEAAVSRFYLPAKRAI